MDSGGERVTDLVITPSPESLGYGSLILSDGTRETDLVLTGSFREGLWLVEWAPPVVATEDTYATSPDMNGSSRTRSKSLNPTGTGKLQIFGEDVGAFWDIVDDLEDLFVQAHNRKGTLAYTPPGGTQVTFQLEAIRLAAMPHDRSLQIRALTVDFEFTCRPYGILAEVTLLTSETLTGPIDFVEITGVPGHVDAFPTAVLTDASGKVRDDVEWGLDEAFDPADVYRIEAVDLVELGGTFSTDHIAGIVSPGRLAICATPELTHVGRYRIKVWADVGEVQGVEQVIDCQVRLAWHAGEDPLVTRPDNLAVPHLTERVIEMDLGIVDIREIEGAQAWTGQIEIEGDTIGRTVDIFAIEIIPAARYGRARSPFALSTATALTAADEFDQVVSGGADPLTGKTARIGGVWAGAGDAEDLEVEDTEHTARRAAFSDGVGAGRFVTLPQTMTTTLVQVDFRFVYVSTMAAYIAGALARFADTSNWLLARCEIYPTRTEFRLAKKVAGVLTVMPPIALQLLVGPATSWLTVRLYVDEDGLCKAWVFPAGGDPVEPDVSIFDADLATGGALASGKPGILDEYQGLDPPVRQYDNFAAYEPAGDHALWDDQSLRLDESSAQRENEVGTRWGDVPRYEGKRLLLPPATRNGRTSRLVVKQDRNDLVTAPVGDANDELTLDLSCRPRVLLTTKNP